MKKVDFREIVYAHRRTLKNEATGRISTTDIATFIGLPLLIAVSAAILKMPLKPESYPVVITFFGILVPLLLNIQVALFSILQRQWRPLEDIELEKKQIEMLSMRKDLATQLNANVSYATLISTIGLSFMLTVYVTDASSPLLTSISSFIFTHFILTFLMIVKRTFSLFSVEIAKEQS